MQKTQPNVEIDILKWLYFEAKDVLEKESDRIQVDVTSEFNQYLHDKISSGELINMAFKGEVAGSKSTSAISCCYTVNKALEKIYNKKIDDFSHIVADQTEFLRFVNREESHVAIVIDEFSNLAQTGLNASTETALFDYYSDVFAQKYVHRFSCSPSIILDRNATVIMEYIGKDITNKISRFKCSYRNPSDGFREVVLGHVNLDVSNVLDKKFYQRYRKKKFDRMSLLDRHGVRDIRELEFAGIILPVVGELRFFTMDGSRVVVDTILSTVSRICRENKRIYSLLTLNEISSRVKSLLHYHSEIARCDIRIIKSKNDVEIELLKKKREKYIEMMGKDYTEEQRRNDIYNEYLNIK